MFLPNFMYRLLLLIFLSFFCVQLFAADYYIRFQSEKDSKLVLDGIKQSLPVVSLQQMLSQESIDYYRSSEQKNTNNKLASFSSKSNLEILESRLKRSYRISFEVIADPKNIYSTLSGYSEIESFAPCPVYEKHCGSFNDPLSSQQDLLDLINLCEANDIEVGSPDIVIAVSDDGFHSEHEDVVGQLWSNNGEILDGIDNDNNGYIDDLQGYSFYPKNGSHAVVKGIATHGTQVGGIFAANPDNSLGIVGTGLKCSVFPIRTAPFTDQAPINFGYESILYAAVMGFDVINCSWGSVKNNSVFTEDIVAFANERNLTVVNSVGNRYGIATTKYRYSGQYPSVYEGVIGVGQSTYSDRVAGTGNLGANTDIFAPGAGNYTIDNFDTSGYEASANGTSFSAPVVAGIVGLVKSRWPNLTNLQIEAHLRNTGFDITDLNPDYSHLEPKRIDAFRAVSENPMSKPGIAVVGYRYLNSEGAVVGNPVSGESYRLQVDLKNYLASLPSSELVLSSVFGNEASDGKDKLILTDPVKNMVEIGSDEMVSVEFPVVIGTKNFDRVVLKINIYNSEYSSVVFFDVYNSNEIYDFTNGTIGISVAENGLIGYTRLRDDIDERKNLDFFGNGIWVNGQANVLFNGFLFAMEEDRGIVASSQTAYDSGVSEFEIIEGFDEDPRNRLVLQTDNLPEKLDIRIQKEIKIAKSSDKYLRISLVNENRFSEPLFDAGIGYFMDIDLAKTPLVDYDANIIEDTRDWLPAELKRSSVSMATVSRPDSSNFFTVAVRSDDENAVAQIFSRSNSAFSQSNDSDLIQSLSQGVSLVGVDTPTDIMSVVGMRWEGFWEIGQLTECDICLAGGETKIESINQAVKCLQEFNSSVFDKPDNDDLSQIIYRSGQPINNEGESICIIDINGREILSTNKRIIADDMAIGAYIIIREQERGMSLREKALILR